MTINHHIEAGQVYEWRGLPGQVADAARLRLDSLTASCRVNVTIVGGDKPGGVTIGAADLLAALDAGWLVLLVDDEIDARSDAERFETFTLTPDTEHMPCCGANPNEPGNIKVTGWAFVPDRIDCSCGVIWIITEGAGFDALDPAGCTIRRERRARVRG